MGKVCRKEASSLQKELTADGTLEAEAVPDQSLEVPPLQDVPHTEPVADQPPPPPTNSFWSEESASLLRHCPDRQCYDPSELMPNSAADLCSSNYRARLAAGCNARVVAMIALPVAFLLVGLCALISSARGASLRASALLIPVTTTSTTSTVSTTFTTMPTSTVTTTGTTTVSTDSCRTSPGWPCLGSINLEGHGLIHMISAGANKPNEKVGATGIANCKEVTPYKQGRVYFGERCNNEARSNSDYAAINFLGKVLRFSVDLSNAHCGCVAAFYLVNMRQNTDPGLCNRDFYCDANKVCGVACAEVDIMEANREMYRFTMHNSSDKDGRRAQFHKKYGPGNKCINTEKAFNVRAAISYDGSSVTVNLEQGGCSLEATIIYAAMSVPFWAGMTPVISYWYNDRPGSMKWFDGTVCKKYNPKHACGEHVRLSNFSLSGTDDDMM